MKLYLMELERARTCKLVTLPETRYVDCSATNCTMPQKGYVGNVYYVSENITDEIVIDIFCNKRRSTLPLKMHNVINSILERYPYDDKIPLVWLSTDMLPMKNLNVYIHANTEEKWGIQYDYWPDDDPENLIVSTTLDYTRCTQHHRMVYVPFGTLFIIIKLNSPLLMPPKIKHYTLKNGFSDTFELEDNVYIAPLIPDIYDIESLKFYLQNISDNITKMSGELIDICIDNCQFLDEKVICFAATKCILLKMI